MLNKLEILLFICAGTHHTFGLFIREGDYKSNNNNNKNNRNKREKHLLYHHCVVLIRILLLVRLRTGKSNQNPILYCHKIFRYGWFKRTWITNTCSFKETITQEKGIESINTHMWTYTYYVYRRSVETQRWYTKKNYLGNFFGGIKLMITNFYCYIFFGSYSHVFVVICLLEQNVPMPCRCRQSSFSMVTLFKFKKKIKVIYLYH